MDSGGVYSDTERERNEKERMIAKERDLAKYR